MGNFPAAIIVAIGLSRLFIAFMVGALPTYLDLDPCDDWLDVFDGCAGLGGSIFGFVVGTIPGMPSLLNGAQAFVVNVLLFWAIRQIVGGNG